MVLHAEAEDAAAEADRVEFAAAVMPEGHDGRERRIGTGDLRRPLRGHAVLVGPDPARADVGEEVGPDHRRALAAIDLAAGDDRAEVAPVFEDRQHRSRRRVAEAALRQVPAVVLAAVAGPRLEVDLLPRRLPDVGDVEIAVLVEGDPPRVAEPVGPDLVGAVLADEGVVAGNGVVAAGIRREIVAVDIEPEDLAEEHILVLAVAVGVVAAAAVADADIEVAVVRPEHDGAAIVVPIHRMRHLDDRLDRTGIRVGRPGVFADLDVAVRIHEMDEVAAVGGVVGMKGEAEHALFAAGA